MPGMIERKDAHAGAIEDVELRDVAAD